MSDKTKISFNKTPEQILEARRQRELDPRQAAERERMSALKAPRQPLGGAPPVHIPPLNAEPIERGGPMAEQAETLRDPTSPLSPMYSPELAMMAKKPGEGPFSTLPPEAQEQPGFIKGVGSMISSNQPFVNKGDKGDKDGYKPTLSEKTRDSMAALAAFQAQAEVTQAKQAKEESTEEDKKRQEDAANLGKVVEKTEKNLYNELRDIIGDNAQFNLLNNPDRRKKIEGRLGELNITDVIIYGEIRQDVIIIPDKLIVTYRSVSAEEDLAVKQMMFGEAGGDRYLMDKYTIMQLSLALVSINGDELPTHLDDKKKFNEERFLKKFEKVIKFPIQFIADLGVQYLWFDERVRRLFVGTTEELKNT